MAFQGENRKILDNYTSFEVFNNIIQYANDAIISMDLEGKIRYWNVAASQLFEYTYKEVLGKSISLLIPNNKEGEEKRLLNRIISGELVRYFETERVTKFGKRLYISISLSPIRDAKDQIIGVTKIARDISNLIMTRKELQRYTEKLEYLNRQKEDFISLTSHELKTPLSSAKAYVQMLGRSLGGDEQKLSLIGKAANSLNRLESLINDLLDLSKINIGKLSYRMEPLDFAEVMENCTESMRAIYHTHEIILNRVDNAVIMGDRLRLEQVLNNFISNAIKYSPDGHKIELGALRHGRYLVVSIKDYGIGIPDEAMTHLFNRYYRVESSEGKFPGLGLGLYIVSDILIHHKGSFWFESELNKGSTFYFLLPLYEAGAKEQVTVNGPQHYRDNEIEIKYLPEQELLVANWTGYQNIDSLKKGCRSILKMLRENKCNKILNKNDRIKGSWSESADWVGKKWLPLIENLGVKQFAWVMAKHTFGRLSAQKSIELFKGEVVIKEFEKEEEAERWLGVPKTCS